MNDTLYDKVVRALRQAEQHNSNIMVKPEVILWPDTERQWEAVIPVLQKEFPALIIFGVYDAGKKQGPAIWVKCMVAKMLPEANWPADATPIIYMPGISKNDLKNITAAGLDLQPLMEYQYTGTIFTQVSGREWTVLAFTENQQSGLGLKVAQDKATRDALVKVLPSVFQDRNMQFPTSLIDADYLHSVLVPDAIPHILKWMCKGDVFLKSLSSDTKDAFINICRSRFGFEPDYKNIKDIVEKFGAQRNAWKQVWQLYASAPKKYPELEGLLRLAKPVDLGSLFALPEESWPQVNEEKEDELCKALLALSKLQFKEALQKLTVLGQQHKDRRLWVWSELGYAPLANALPDLVSMAEVATTAYASASVEELKEYYVKTGYKADQFMRKALAPVKLEKDKKAIKSLITTLYKPWLESITQKFQTFIEKDASVFTKQNASTENEEFVLFVDAFRYELASEFAERLTKRKYKVELQSGWSAIPSLTPTAKANVSPVAAEVLTNSNCREFVPQLKSGKDLVAIAFREALAAQNYIFVTAASDIIPGQRHWQEIGEVDKKGHEEQAEMVKRIEELFEQVQEAIEIAFENGIRRIKIVTDHGWLLLPGGLPKEELRKDLTETRWGRCALIKEGAKTDLMHLPWRWNPNIFIAYAPGISFFKKNEEYAHGGISIHECLVPTLTIEKPNQSTVAAKIADIKWVGLNCKVTTTDALNGYLMDIRTKFNDAKTSIVLLKSREKKVLDNKISLMVDSDAESKSTVIVLMDENETILDKKPTLVGI